MFVTHRMQRFARMLLIAAALGSAMAMAQSAEPSLAEVYAAASAGRLEQAQTMVQQVLLAHPDSAKAQYVRSELFARQGDLRRAREALAIAQRLAPGLPFAKPASVRTLRTELAAGNGSGSLGMPAADAARTLPAASWGLLLVLAGAVVLAGHALFRRRRPQPATTQPVFASDDLGTPDALGVGGGAGVMQGGIAQPASRAGAAAPPASGGLGGPVLGGVATGLAVGAGMVAAQTIGHRLLAGNEPRADADDLRTPLATEPLPNRNTDMGGPDFGVTEIGSWDDATSLDVGSGDWGT